MTDIDYPPTRSITLDNALAQANDRVSDLEPDAEDEDAERGIVAARSQRDALAWALDQWGDEATVDLQAYTARDRARVHDTVRNEIMGDIGGNELQVWMVAAALTDAPWLDDKDLQSKAQATARLPPALVDWVKRQLDDINDLTEGN